MTDIVNGLAVTRHRLAFLRAVNHRGRIVRYHSTGEAFDDREGWCVTARLSDALRAGWVEPVPEGELWPGAHSKTYCTYYRCTEIGRRILTGGNS